MKDENSEKGYSGYIVDLLDVLSELLKFEYTMYESPDGEYGRMSPDKVY